MYWMMLIGLELSGGLCLAADSSGMPPADDLDRLTRKLEADPAAALVAARDVFDRWCKASPDLNSLELFRHRLSACESLRKEILRRLQAVGQGAIQELVGSDLWDDGRPVRGKSGQPSAASATSTPLVPPEQLYRLYLPHFQYAIDTRDLQPAEKSFLRAYYNAEVRDAIAGVVQVGRPLAAARDRHGLAHLECYLLLLPLLHDTSRFSADSLRGLPDWMFAPDRLRALSDFCLFRAGRLDAAEAIAVSMNKSKSPSEAGIEFYTEASARCAVAHMPGVAVECLRAAIGRMDGRDPRAVGLRFQICDIWAGVKNWALAAGEAGGIARDYPGQAEAGRALCLRLEYLAAQGDNQAILYEVDDAINQPFCKECLPRLLYQKWSVLREAGRGPEATLVLKDFLNRYPKEPFGAEMYFAIARDCLAAQRYHEALAVLESLKAHYPDSPSAKQSAALIDKLYEMQGRTASRPSSRPDPS